MRSAGGAPPSDESLVQGQRSRRIRLLASAVVLSLTGLLGPPVAGAQQQYYSIFFVSNGEVFESDVAMGPPSGGKVYSDDTVLTETIGPAGDSIFTISRRSSADRDPYFASRLRVTNLQSTPISLAFSIRLPMVSVPTTPPLPTFAGAFTAELTDANGDGVASYSGGGAGFALSHVLGASLTPSHSISLTEPGSAVVYDVLPTAVPTSFTGQWNRLEIAHLASPPGGGLSPGDTVEFYVFGCVALPATTCPTAPALPLPEPEVAASVGAGVVILAGWTARRRRRR